jgi:hypothetical protein
MSFPQLSGQSIFGGWEQLAIDIGDNGLFLEMAVKIQIESNLEAECERQEAFWRNRILDLRRLSPDSRFSVPQIQRVDSKNLYMGARPSLLQAPIEFWPSVTVRCGDLRPARDGAQPDQYDTFDCDLYVEVMTYAGPVDRDHLHLQEGINSEGDVNMQVHLLSSAVQMCIRKDPTFGGAIMPIQNPPIIVPSFPTALPGNDQERVGDYYHYQGRQLTYVVTRNSY